MPCPIARFPFVAILLPLLGISIVAADFASAEGRGPVEQRAACRSGKTITIRAARNGATVDAVPGDVIRVEMPVQAGTGYTWQLMPEGSVALATAGLVAPAAPARPGGPATQVFTLRAAAAGEQALELHYLRPWETGKPPARIFKVSVKVAGC